MDTEQKMQEDPSLSCPEPVASVMFGAKESSVGWDEMMGKDICVKKLVEGEGQSADMKSTVYCSLRMSILTPDSNNGTMKLEEVETLNNERYMVGESDCIPGLELPLRHSKAGDRFLVRCHSKFAYGPNGRPELKTKCADGSVHITRAVPPNSNLQFEVYVKDHFDEFQEGEEMALAAAVELMRDGSDGGNGGGDSGDSFVDTVGVDSDATADTAGFSSKKSNQPKFAYKRSTNTRGDPVDVIRNNIVFRKEIGNRWFSYKDYQKAARAYAKGIKTAEDYVSRQVPKTPEQVQEESIRAQLADKQQSTHEPTPEEKFMTDKERINKINATAAAEAKKAADAQKGQEVKLDPGIITEYVHCLNNLTTSYILLEQWTAAKDVCLRVLELDRNNVKGLIRAAKVSLHFSNYDDAQMCLDKAAQIEPDRPELVGELARLNKARSAYRKREREMSKQMTKRLFPEKPPAGEKHLPDGKSVPKTVETAAKSVIATSDSDNSSVPVMKEEEKKKKKTEVAVAPSTTVSFPQSDSVEAVAELKPVTSTLIAPATVTVTDVDTGTAKTVDVTAKPVVKPVTVSAGEVANNFIYLAVIILCLAIGAAIALKGQFV